MSYFLLALFTLIFLILINAQNIKMRINYVQTRNSWILKTMSILLKWLVTAAAILITAYLLPGVSVSGLWAALWLAVFLGIINIIIKPILIIFTLPINILTLGLFTFVINALLILLASSVIKGFEVSGFLAAFGFSIVLSIISYVLNSLFKQK